MRTSKSIYRNLGGEAEGYWPNGLPISETYFGGGDTIIERVSYKSIGGKVFRGEITRKLISQTNPTFLRNLRKFWKQNTPNPKEVK